ncbi:MAG: hypothetical protein JNM33_11565 [Rubrivivax sp.]|nr:hypothetical protein [Rubrivivax sp.]
MSTATEATPFRPMKPFVNGVLLAPNGHDAHPGVREPFDGLVAAVEGTTIPEAGHLIAEAQPAAVVAEILAFGRRHAERLAMAPAPA